jgi:DNA-binding NarL/FixJ family response regulator
MRVVIVDDHPLYLDAAQRQLVRAFRGAEMCCFSMLADALVSLADTPADLVMLDFSMPGMEGPAGVARVVAAASPAAVVVMSGVASSRDVMACIAAGARGFLPKTVEGRVFTDAVSVVLHGGTYVPAEFIGSLPPLVEPSSNAGDALGGVDLTSREKDLLRMVAAGAANKEIARKMGLQEVTVKFYLTRLFRRLGVKNRSQAAVAAVRLGLADEERLAGDLP